MNALQILGHFALMHHNDRLGDEFSTLVEGDHAIEGLDPVVCTALVMRSGSDIKDMGRSDLWEAVIQGADKQSCSEVSVEDLNCAITAIMFEVYESSQANSFEDVAEFAKEEMRKAEGMMRMERALSHYGLRY